MPTSRSSYYKDLREWLQELEYRKMLHRITQSVIKETEISPLVRLQFRGLPEEQRKGFLFENVKDVKNRAYDIRVATGVYASSLPEYTPPPSKCMRWACSATPRGRPSPRGGGRRRTRR